MINNYKEATEFLFGSLPVFEKVGASAYKPGLENVTQLSDSFGSPHKHLSAAIHVAGTNGKGSTCHTLAAILQERGYKVGLFTSPHLADFRERIRVNGTKISEQYVVDFVNEYHSKRLNLSPSFFELTTVMAFKYFAECDVDIAVIEVGLGGRLDSTNIITPVLSIITNISLDHTSLLGKTREEIAREKAGIIKPGVPVVIGELDPETSNVFNTVASKNRSDIFYVRPLEIFNEVSSLDDHYLYKSKRHGEFTGELTGECQPLNSATILTAVDVLNQCGIKISDEAIARGFSNVVELTGLLGRWTTLRKNPVVVCDTGHNPAGWSSMIRQINDLPGRKHLVIGFVNDKDVQSILELIKSNIDDAKFYFTAPACHRALPAETLCELASRIGMRGDVFASVEEAYRKALADCDKGDSIFVGGSNYVVAEIISML
ncbi:MAG: bifunctional folylpolyglutamate synthase/dihydrofolate synthase [Bacteroides sp.]|nr:bifunctional folylpolyglutamate synthase/dihydrofolate synthase [Bacteroides sp.]